MSNMDGKKLNKAYKLSVLAVCIFYALYIACVPLQLSASADVELADSFLPQTINFFGKILEVCGMAVCYAIAAYAVYRRGKGGIGMGYLIYGVSALVKCTASQTVYWIVEGGIPAFNNGLVGEALWLIVLPAALDLIQFAIFFIISASIIMRFRRIYDEAYAASKGEYPEMDRWVFPFKKIFDLKNPLLAACFTGGAVICASKLIMRIIEEIDMAINGLPIQTMEDFLISFAGFASDIACGVLAYTVMIFVIIKAFEPGASSEE